MGELRSVGDDEQLRAPYPLLQPGSVGASVAVTLSPAPG